MINILLKNVEIKIKAKENPFSRYQTKHRIVAVFQVIPIEIKNSL